MIKLTTPYHEKDQVKRLGAEWNKEERFWFVPEHLNYRPFRQWIEPDEWEKLESFIELPFAKVFEHINENLNIPFIRYQIEADVINEFHITNAKIINLIDNHKHNRVLTVFIPQKLNINVDLREKRVKVTGLLDFYTGNGQFQLIAEKIDVIGDCSRLNRLSQWETECQNILEEGTANKQFKLDFSKILKVGVITSKNSEGYDDFKSKISQYIIKNEEQFELKLLELSADNMAHAIAELNESGCDCICLIRGGGDKESLLPFSDPILLSAIYRSQIPIIIGVGHKSDLLLCKRVKGAHNADTPTGAAEYLNMLSRKQYSESISAKQNDLQAKLAESENQKILLKKEVKNLTNEKTELVKALNLARSEITELKQKLNNLNQPKKKGFFQKLFGR